MTGTFIDAEGDTFLLQRTDDRVRAVLSDGLGSCTKALVLSTLTATLALRCLERHLPADRTASLILESLPVCSVRKIAYATFTLVDADTTGRVRLWEYETPPALLIRNGLPVPVERTKVAFGKGLPRHETLRRSEFQAVAGDRLLFCSDGVTQSGMGSIAFPLGWGRDRWAEFSTRVLSENPELSSRRLARLTVQEALNRDSGKAKDDISSLGLYFREPRDLLVVTGPPFDPSQDEALVEAFRSFVGKKIICGGTTAQLIARGLGRPIQVELSGDNDGLPPRHSWKASIWSPRASSPWGGARCSWRPCEPLLPSRRPPPSTSSWPSSTPTASASWSAPGSTRRTRTPPCR